MKKKIVIPALIAIVAVAAWVIVSLGRSSETEYRFVQISRGNVRSVVSSTGTLQAIKTVEVGTQVSGKITAIYADYNDRVTAGQLIALVDPTLLKQAVRSAEADLLRGQAELTQATQEKDRIERLYERQVSTESEHATALYQYTVAQASLTSAEVNLERARQNLSYAEVRAPVDGVVLARTVDVGQTVAASLSAPQIFLIAGDLAAMEILASVDESDIGAIREGQRVEFTVQAYPSETFAGTVRQLRLQPTSQDNVVSYTVVVSVANPDGRLLPGMTATVEFIVAEAIDVLKVSNTALRFTPTAQMLAAVGGPRTKTDASSAGATIRLWTLDSAGKPTTTSVQTGITDGQATEISGSGIREGMQLIAAIANGTSSSAGVNPFQTQQSRSMPGPPPPGM
jgi:HlyD family secretion protein